MKVYSKIIFLTILLSFISIFSAFAGQKNSIESAGYTITTPGTVDIITDDLSRDNPDFDKYDLDYDEFSKYLKDSRIEIFGIDINFHYFVAVSPWEGDSSVNFFSMDDADMDAYTTSFKSNPKLSQLNPVSTTWMTTDAAIKYVEVQYIQQGARSYTFFTTNGQSMIRVDFMRTQDCYLEESYFQRIIENTTYIDPEPINESESGTDIEIDADNASNQRSEENDVKLPKFFDYLLMFIETLVVLFLPFFIYRKFIRKESISARNARRVLIIYFLVVYIITVVVNFSILDSLDLSSNERMIAVRRFTKITPFILWGLIDYRMLTKVNQNSAENNHESEKQAKTDEELYDYEVTLDEPELKNEFTKDKSDNSEYKTFQAMKVHTADNHEIQIEKRTEDKTTKIASNVDKQEVLYCRKCGRKIPVDSDFCQFCGTPVEHET